MMLKECFRIKKLH